MQKTILYRNQQVAYEVTGNGLPVMLLHGFAEDRLIWHPLLKELGEKYRWLVPDLPGSGGSSLNPALHSIPDFAEIPEAIRKEEHIRQMVIIGHSMGGYISLAFAEKYPEMLKGLGLFHSTAYGDKAEKKEARKKSIQFIRNHGVAPYVQQSLPGLYSDTFKKRYPEIIQEQIARYAGFQADSLAQYLTAMINRKDTTRVLKNMDAPVLFIMGEEDKAVPLEDGLEQCHLPRTSYIHVLPGTAHMGMLEKTSLCNAFVDHFLEQIPFNFP